MIAVAFGYVSSNWYALYELVVPSTPVPHFLPIDHVVQVHDSDDAGCMRYFLLGRHKSSHKQCPLYLLSEM